MRKLCDEEEEGEVQALAAGAETEPGEPSTTARASNR